MIPGSERNWIAVNAVQQIQSQQKVKTKNMTTLIVRNSINRPPLRHGLVLITLVLACFGLLPQTQAALPPEIPGNPDGCYPAFNTAEGCNALADLGAGIGNTGLGWYALGFNFGGSLNTAVGAGALRPSVLQRFCSTKRGRVTRPSARGRSLSTTTRTQIRP